ncbi:MAG: iron-containing alcohol dehydrogenase [Actinobacteria bacterium]|nr:iron-containing alcohol dehydrogenase [Actinomycetota bacterium]
MTLLTLPGAIGTGPVGELFADLATHHGWTRVAVITGTAVAGATDLAACIEDSHNRVVETFARGPAHAPVEHVEQLAAELRTFGPDVVVSAGGGSSHDAAKGVRTLLAHGGRLEDHCLRYFPPDRLERPDLSGPKLAHVTVPTTLSGSEANGAAGFAAGPDGKRVLADDSLLPRAVLIDREILATTPERIFRASAMNALDHGVEGLASRGRSPVTAAILRGALRELAAATATDSDDPSQRERAVVMSALIGTSLPGTWLGLAHAIGHVLGARYAAAHGDCHAIVAGAVVRFNAPAAAPSHEEACAVLGLSGSSDALAAWLDARADAWSLPRRLRDIEVPRGDLDAVAGAVHRDHDTFHNPRPPTPGDIADLLRSMW